MPLAFGFSRSRLVNRRSNHHQASLVLRVWVAFSSASPSLSEPSAADAGDRPATIREGRAEISADKSNSVFYNKAQVNNRDISIAVLRSFISKRREEYATLSTKGGQQDTALREHAKYKAPRVLEALAASGLRAIRYALEVDGIGEVIAIDNSEVAIEACKKNIHHNGSLSSSKVVPHLADARVYMLNNPKEFDVEEGPQLLGVASSLLVVGASFWMDWIGWKRRRLTFIMSHTA